MRTRSSSNLIVESFTILKRCNRRRSKQIVKPELQTIKETLISTMADTCTMSELLQAPTEGYGDAIVLPPILAENFELKITSTLKYQNVSNEAIKLMLFLFYLDGATRIWLEKEPPRSILTWEDIAWDRFKYLLRKCPHHSFLELHQTDTFYNALTKSNQDSLNAAASGNLLNRTPRDALTVIKNTSKVRISRNKPIVSKVNTTTSSPSPSPDVTALTKIVKELVLMNKATLHATVKAIEETCVACGTYNQGGNRYHPQGDPNYRASNKMEPPSFPPSNVQNSQNYNQNRYNQNQGFNQQKGQNFNQGNNNYQAPNNQTQVGPSNDFSHYMKTNDVNMRAMQNQISNMKTELKNEFKTTMLNQNNELKNMMINELKNMMSSFIQMHSPSSSGSLPSNTVANLRGDKKAVTTRSGVTYKGSSIPPTSSPLPKDVEREPEATKDKVQSTSSESTTHVQPPIVQALILEPKSLLSNKEKLFELASTPLNENCLAALLKKLPEKLRDPGKFLIPCEFSELEECLALADLGVSINFMPLFESVNQINVIDVACEEYAQEVLGFLNSSTSGNLTPSDPTIATSSLSFTPFEGSDFILEEIETFLRTPNELSNLDDDYYDTEGDILYLEKLLNEDPSLNLPPMKNEDLEQVDVTMTTPSIEELPELKLKDLPSHLEYAFLDGTDKLPVIIYNELKDEENAAFLKVLKSHKWDIT
nr:hypothetical protein [Tanacetum cinerariifolium]